MVIMVDMVRVRKVQTLTKWTEKAFLPPASVLRSSTELRFPTCVKTLKYWQMTGTRTCECIETNCRCFFVMTVGVPAFLFFRCFRLHCYQIYKPNSKMSLSHFNHNNVTKLELVVTAHKNLSGLLSWRWMMKSHWDTHISILLGGSSERWQNVYTLSLHFNNLWLRLNLQLKLTKLNVL